MKKVTGVYTMEDEKGRLDQGNNSNDVICKK